MSELCKFCGKIKKEHDNNMFCNQESNETQIKIIPTNFEIDDACMWFRHDFGLMTEEEKNKFRFEAKEWLRAWQKTFKIL